MENAADALKIAFAVIIFVIAITLAFNVVSQAKVTADKVIYYTDETNFYDYANVAETNRLVTVSEIIPTIFRYSNESLCVVIKLKNKPEKRFNLSEKSISSIEQLEGELIEYIKDNLMGSRNHYFDETFVEVPISGIYITDKDDGTTLIEAAGSNKIYITYTETDKDIKPE